MFDDFADSTGKLSTDEAFDLLQDLQQNTSDDIRRQRAHFRLAIKSSVILQPGNTSDLLRFKVKGVSGDVSQGGCSILFPLAPRVGDIYRLQFDKEVLDIPLTFARCLRCRLIREDAYEAGFAFFQAITLPEQMAAQYEEAGQG